MTGCVLLIGRSIESLDVGIWWIVFFLLIGMGVYLTVRFRGIQVRCLRRAARFAFGRG